MIESLIGKKIPGSKLVAEKEVGRDRKGVLYLCKCECGGTKVVSASELINKVVKSCRCAYKNNGSHMRKLNATRDAEIVAQRRRKVPVREIARRFRLTTQSVYNVLKRAGI